MVFISIYYFKGLWAFLYFVGFCYLASQWSKADPTPGNYGSSNINAAIVFSLFSIFTWGGCAWFAFQRFKAGVDPTFSSTYDPTANAYASYPVTTDNEQYQDPPFSGGGQPQRGDIFYDFFFFCFKYNKNFKSFQVKWISKPQHIKKTLNNNNIYLHQGKKRHIHTHIDIKRI